MNSSVFWIGWTCLLAIVVVAGCRGGEYSSSNQDSTEDTASEPADGQSPPRNHPANDASAIEIDATSASRELEPMATDVAGSDSTSNSPVAPPRNSKTVVLSEQEPVEQHFPDGSLKGRWHLRLYVTFNRALPLYQQEAGSYEFHGPYEEYYPGGAQLFVKGNYVDGVRDGEWTFWHPNGAKAKAGHYLGGKLQGQWNVWREDGTLLRTENYQNDQKQGQWTTYAQDGETVVRRD